MSSKPYHHDFYDSDSFKMGPEPGFSLHVTIYIDPQNITKFFEHFKPVYDAVIAEPELPFFLRCTNPLRIREYCIGLKTGMMINFD